VLASARPRLTMLDGQVVYRSDDVPW